MEGGVQQHHRMGELPQCAQLPVGQARHRRYEHQRLAPGMALRRQNDLADRSAARKMILDYAQAALLGILLHSVDLVVQHLRGEVRIGQENAPASDAGGLDFPHPRLPDRDDPAALMTHDHMLVLQFAQRLVDGAGRDIETDHQLPDRRHRHHRFRLQRLALEKFLDLLVFRDSHWHKCAWNSHGASPVG